MGKCDEDESYHDLIEVIMVRRGQEALENTLFEYLQGVFTTNFDTINKYVDVENNNEVKEALKTMCGLGESLENKGIQKGIIALVESLKELGQTNEIIINKLMGKFGLTETEAKTYI